MARGRHAALGRRAVHELKQDDCRERIAGGGVTDWVEMFCSVRVLVIGDAILDQYHFGRVERLSPEAPVPIFIEGIIESRRGGADNVAHQLEALGCRVHSVFASRLSVKHRYFAGHHQIFRRDADHQASAEDVEEACKRIAHIIDDIDVVVLSDYNKGLLSTDLCHEVIRLGRPVIVDPKGRDWSKYRGASVICPNSLELGMVEMDAIPASMRIIEKQGPLGLKVHTLRGTHTDCIGATAKQVFDVTGAGDVVTALIAAGVAVGAPLHDAAVIANHAAGVAVGKLGTAVCSKKELIESLKRAHAGSAV
jgi:bifunctional ADP-heptose synthase (sugar kinase/adenylyltransferase)